MYLTNGQEFAVLLCDWAGWKQIKQNLNVIMQSTAVGTNVSELE